MKQLIIVYNPHSSRYADVKEGVLDRQKELKGYAIGKYEIEPTDVDKNAEKLSRILKDGDFVISAGGDATGVISANAILKSGKDVTLAVLPYGNFNDLSHTLGTKTLDDIAVWVGGRAGGTLAARNRGASTVGETARSGPTRATLYPLEIYINDKFFRYATCYATVGMMAESVQIYDTPKMRKALKKNSGRKISSYTNLAKWYFKNRHKKQFIPEFKLNGKLQSKKVSDYAAINGRYLARVMKGRDDFEDPRIFHSKTDNLTSFWRLSKLMIRSIFIGVPGEKTENDVLELIKPGTITIQAEGEYKTFEQVKKIEIRKSKKCLKVITN